MEVSVDCFVDVWIMSAQRQPQNCREADDEPGARKIGAQTEDFLCFSIAFSYIFTYDECKLILRKWVNGADPIVRARGMVAKKLPYYTFLFVASVIS